VTIAPERTLVLVKPDGVRRGLTGEVLRRIEAKGYRVVALELRTAHQDLLDEHYAEHLGKPFFEPLVRFMSSGPVVAAVVEGQRVVEGFRSLAGATDPTKALPGTIRGDLGRDWGGDVVENIVHGSDSPASAEREIKLWFPMADQGRPDGAAGPLA
jgi:nucleoside-diphosphate kinase